MGSNSPSFAGDTSAFFCPRSLLKPNKMSAVEEPQQTAEQIADVTEKTEELEVQETAAEAEAKVDEEKTAEVETPESSEAPAAEETENTPAEADQAEAAPEAPAEE